MIRTLLIVDDEQNLVKGIRFAARYYVSFNERQMVMMIRLS